MILSKIPAPAERGGVHGEAYLQIELRSGKSGKPYIALSSHKTVPSRFNNRTSNDAGRFTNALAGIAGKRLTYDQLTNNVKVKQARLFK